jgi:hypothetical protein
MPRVYIRILPPKNRRPGHVFLMPLFMTPDFPAIAILLVHVKDTRLID